MECYLETKGRLHQRTCIQSTSFPGALKWGTVEPVWQALTLRRLRRISQKMQPTFIDFRDSDSLIIKWSNDITTALFFHCSSICHSLLLTTKAQVPPGVQQLTCAPATTEVSVCHQKKATKSTLTASLYTWVAHVRGDTQEGSVTVTLTPARVMVSPAIQELSALIFHRQPMPVGTNVDHVHQDILGMALSVWVSLHCALAWRKFVFL